MYFLRLTKITFIDFVSFTDENTMCTILQELKKLNLNICYCHSQPFEKGLFYMREMMACVCLNRIRVLLVELVGCCNIRYQNKLKLLHAELCHFLACVHVDIIPVSYTHLLRKQLEFYGQVTLYVKRTQQTLLFKDNSIINNFML